MYNLHILNDIIDEEDNWWAFGGCVFVNQSTCAVFTDNKLWDRIHKSMSQHIQKYYSTTTKSCGTQAKEERGCG